MRLAYTYRQHNRFCGAKTGSIQSWDLFTYNVKMIKGTAHKNDDVHNTCKRGLKAYLHQAMERSQDIQQKISKNKRQTSKFSPPH